MKARRVRGLDPDGALADNAERVVMVRLDELCGFMPRVADPDEQHALHDMRIAAKRLRYVLEITQGCFGPYAHTAAKRAKQLQTLLGEIHDCDEHRPEVEDLIADLRSEDLAAVLAASPAGAADLDMTLVAVAPHGAAYTGLVAVATALDVRRRVLFAHFLERWRDLEREGFRARLEYAVGERPKAVKPDPGAGGEDSGPGSDPEQPVSSSFPAPPPSVTP